MEETTTGVIRLKAMEADGALAFPVIAVNDARTKHLFDNRYGTGQSTIDGIIRATNVLLAGKRFVVAGYGWTGRGVAMRARGMGAHVIVTEVDPMRSLEALMEGYEVMPMARGRRDRRHLLHRDRRQARDRAGAHRADEGRHDPLQHRPLQRRDRHPGAALARDRDTRGAQFVEEFTLADGRRIYLLAEGRLVNISAAEGHPAIVMDMSFANQALSTEYAVQHAASLEKKVYPVPTVIDEEIARLKLATMGVVDRHAHRRAGEVPGLLGRRHLIGPVSPAGRSRERAPGDREGSRC